MSSLGRWWTLDSLDTSTAVVAYETLPEERKMKDADALEIAKSISYRLFTEWCMNTPWQHHGNYKGQALKEWVDSETHFALERAGFQWDPNRGHFVPDNDVRAVYEETRGRVIAAMMEHAANFFRECNDYRNPRPGDTRNLRAPLQPYLDRKPEQERKDEPDLNLNLPDL